MRSLLLRLEGPMQSWATQSKFGIRDTDREPSKSGVLGLLGAALGMDRDDDRQLAELRALSLAVRVDRPGTLLHDYHTAGGGRFRGNDRYFVFEAGSCVPTDRYYLQDACFTAAVSGDAALIARLAEAVRSPRWPLFLGRRACPPSTPPYLGVVEGPAREAIRRAPQVEARETRRDWGDFGDATPRRLRLVVEATPQEGGEPRYDDPLSFRAGAKRYGLRHVKTEWLELPATERPTEEATP